MPDRTDSVDAELLKRTRLPALFPFRLLLALAATLASLAAAEPEDELKAATVLTFLRHCEWSKAPAGGPLTLGVLGRSAMVDALRRTVDGKTANGRAVRVVALRRSSECPDCQAVYLAGDNRGELKHQIAGLRLPGLLVMGESEHLLELGGAVNLFIVHGHMSFEVSQEALSLNGIAISSKLLRYGRVVGRQP
jgi:hypothetical protein